ACAEAAGGPLPRCALTALAAKGLVGLDQGGVLQRQVATRPDAAASRIPTVATGALRTGARSAIAAHSAVALNDDSVQDQGAKVVDGAPLRRSPGPRCAAVFQRQVFQRQGTSPGHVEQTKRGRPGSGTPLDDTAVAKDGQIVCCLDNRQPRGAVRRV